MTYMATPQHKNPYPGGHEIYNFGRPFCGHHYYILGLSDLCLGVEKMIFKEIMHFYYMTYMATPQHKNPYPGGHEIYNFGRPSLGHHYYIHVNGLSDLCLGVEKKIFKEIQQFTLLPQNDLPFGWGGHEIYNFLSPYPTYQIWLRFAQ